MGNPLAFVHVGEAISRRQSYIYGTGRHPGGDKVSVLAGGGISGVSARRAECPSHGACARVSERVVTGKGG